MIHLGTNQVTNEELERQGYAHLTYSIIGRCYRYQGRVIHSTAEPTDYCGRRVARLADVEAQEISVQQAWEAAR